MKCAKASSPLIGMTVHMFDRRLHAVSLKMKSLRGAKRKSLLLVHSTQRETEVMKRCQEPTLVEPKTVDREIDTNNLKESLKQLKHDSRQEIKSLEKQI